MTKQAIGKLLKLIPSKQTNVVDNDTLNDTLNDRQIAILKILKNDNNSTVEKLAQQLEVTQITIKRDLKKLQNLKKIKRIGSKKTGYWVVII